MTRLDQLRATYQARQAVADAAQAEADAAFADYLNEPGPEERKRPYWVPRADALEAV